MQNFSDTKLEIGRHNRSVHRRNACLLSIKYQSRVHIFLTYLILIVRLLFYFSKTIFQYYLIRNEGSWGKKITQAFLPVLSEPINISLQSENGLELKCMNFQHRKNFTVLSCDQYKGLREMHVCQNSIGVRKLSFRAKSSYSELIDPE